MKRNPHLNKRLEALLYIHGTTCYLCNQEMLYGVDRLHVDHRIPVSHGGTNDWDNLMPVHAPCNMIRKRLPLSDWYHSHGIEKAIASIHELREESRLQYCIDCGCDISHLDLKAWRCKPCVRAKKNDESRKFYNQNKARVLKRQRDKYQTDEIYRTQKNAQRKARWHNDHEWRRAEATKRKRKRDEAKGQLPLF